MNYPKSFTELQECLKYLPGIGNKSAERLVYHILEMDMSQVETMCQALLNVKKNLHYCKVCGHLTESDLCEICEDKDRDNDVIMVVEKPQDVYAMEKVKTYHGRYHVLHGVVSMMDGIGIEDLNTDSLFDRLQLGEIKEVIIATNLTREGETTALYLSKLLAPYDVVVSRIAHGLPIGSNIDYADDLTLIKSIEGRTKY